MHSAHLEPDGSERALQGQRRLGTVHVIERVLVTGRVAAHLRSEECNR